MVATPSPDGVVLVTFERSGNAREVTFLVERRTPEGGWRLVAHGTRTRYVLFGFPPGVEARFRVVATRCGQRAAASPIATIYPAGGGASRVARRAVAPSRDRNRR